MREGATLPDRCVKTNVPVGSERLVRTVYWHHPALYLVILASLLLYLVVALFIRKKMIVRLGVSEPVLARLRVATAAGWALGVGGLVLLIAAGSVGSGTFFLIAATMLVVGLVWGALGARVVIPRRIDGGYVWLAGASPDFLRTLPAWADHRSV
jgi:hypothetical protein